MTVTSLIFFAHHISYARPPSCMGAAAILLIRKKMDNSNLHKRDSFSSLNISHAIQVLPVSQNSTSLSHIHTHHVSICFTLGCGHCADIQYAGTSVFQINRTVYAKLLIMTI